MLRYTFMAGPRQKTDEDRISRRVPERMDQYGQIFQRLRDQSPAVRVEAVQTLARYLELNMRPVEKSDIDLRYFPVLAKQKEMQRTLGSEIDIRFFPALLYQRAISIQEALRGLTHTDPDARVREAAQSALESIDDLLNPRQTSSRPR
jgi:hypothetical protein